MSAKIPLVKPNATRLTTTELCNKLDILPFIDPYQNRCFMNHELAWWIEKQYTYIESDREREEAITAEYLRHWKMWYEALGDTVLLTREYPYGPPHGLALRKVRIRQPEGGWDYGFEFTPASGWTWLKVARHYLMIDYNIDEHEVKVRLDLKHECKSAPEYVMSRLLLPYAASNNYSADSRYTAPRLFELLLDAYL